MKHPDSITGNPVPGHYVLPLSLRPDSGYDDCAQVERVLQQASQHIAMLRVQAWMLWVARSFESCPPMASVSSLALYFDEESDILPAVVNLSWDQEAWVFRTDRPEFRRADGSIVPMSSDREELRDFLSECMAAFPDGYLPRVLVNRMDMKSVNNAPSHWTEMIMQLLSADQQAQAQAQWLAQDTVASSAPVRPRF